MLHPPAFLTPRRIVGAVALSLWLASLTKAVIWPCADPGVLNPPFYGIGILIFGWTGPMHGQFGWFANPLMLWIIGRLLLQYRAPLVPALISFGLALSSFTWTNQAGDAGWGKLCKHGSGFYLWIACAAVLAAMALIEAGLIKHRTRQETEAA
jgi:hypothetical protein